MPIENLSPEEINAKHYSACLDSVSLITNGKLETQSDSEWRDSVKRNSDHLELMLGKDFWTTENLTPISDAVTLAKSILT
jgi:hypothetical protein